MHALVLTFVFGLFGANSIVEGLKARATGAHTLSWRAGYFLKGKQVPWWVPLGSGVVAVLVAAVVVFLEYPRDASRDFDLALPPGFSDLSGPALEQNAALLGVAPEEVAKRAMGSAAVGAVRDDDRLSFIEVRVMEGPWSPSLARLEETAQRMRPAASSGEQLEVGGYEIVEVNGVESGRFTATSKAGDLTRRSLVYVLPAGASRAYLAYNADERDYEKHLPAFQAMVERARLTAPLPTLPFSPFYLVIGVALLQGIVTWATAKPIVESVPMESPPRAATARTRRQRTGRRRAQREKEASGKTDDEPEHDDAT